MRHNTGWRGEEPRAHDLLVLMVGVLPSHEAAEGIRPAAPLNSALSDALNWRKSGAAGYVIMVQKDEIRNPKHSGTVSLRRQ